MLTKSLRMLRTHQQDRNAFSGLRKSWVTTALERNPPSACYITVLRSLAPRTSHLAPSPQSPKLKRHPHSTLCGPAPLVSRSRKERLFCQSDIYDENHTNCPFRNLDVLGVVCGLCGVEPILGGGLHKPRSRFVVGFY